MTPTPAPLRDRTAGRLALGAWALTRAVAVPALRLAWRAAARLVRWAVPDPRRPGRTVTAGLVIAAVLALVLGTLEVPLLVAAVYGAVAWAGRRLARPAQVPMRAVRGTRRLAATTRRELTR